MTVETRSLGISRSSRAAAVKPARQPVCGVPTASGEPCPLHVVSGDVKCFQHSDDPQVVERRLAARTKGGVVATSKRLQRAIDSFPPITLATPEGARGLLQAAAKAVIENVVTPAQSNALSNLVGMAIRLDELRLSARVAALEEELTLTGNSGARPRVVVEGEVK